MKIAVLSDIHGNLAALEAVLADAAACGSDLAVNLGDICSGPLHPCETAQRLMALDLPTIRGNHERQLLTTPRHRMIPSDRHAAERLTGEQTAWLASLPESLSLNGGLLLVHGTPRSDVEPFLETIDPDGLRPSTTSEREERSGGVAAQVILCGHTHLPGHARLASGTWIVNPGSVGLQAYADDMPHPHLVETGSPHARYAMLDDDGGEWRIALRQVAYDWNGAADTAEANGRPDWARALRTGRV